MKRALPIVGALVVALLVVWWWRGRSGDHATPSSPITSASGSGGETSGAGQAVIVRPRVDPATVQRGALAGTVTQEGGGPVANAQVCASGHAASIDDELFREPTCTTTDAAGTYVIEKLLPASYHVSAAAPTFRPGQYAQTGAKRRRPVELKAGERKAGLDIVLRPGGVQVTGVVLDLTGGPIAKAKVTSTRGRWGRSVDGPPVETDEAGAFTLWADPGSTQVSARADGYADGEATARAPGQVEILLTPESALAGTVVDARTNAPIAGATVSLEGSEWSPWSSGDTATVTTDAAGTFRIARLTPGRYSVFAKAEHGYGRTDGSVLVGLGQSVDGIVIKAYPAFHVSGTVLVASTKEPCEAAWIEMIDTSQNESANLEQGEDKVWRADGVLPGTYSINVGCEGKQSRAKYAPVVVATKDVTGLVWEVDDGATVKGRVLDAVGKPVEGASVFARSTGGDARSRASYSGDLSEPDGAYVLAGLKAGTYKLEVLTDAGVAPTEGYPVEVPGLETITKDLVLAAGGSIAGTVTDETGKPVANATIMATSGAQRMRFSGRENRTDAAGAYRIEGLNPGTYRVVATRGWLQQLRKPGSNDDARQGEPATVKVNATTTVNLVVEAETGSITGIVTDTKNVPITDAYVTATRESDAAGSTAQGTRAYARWSDDKPSLTATDGTFTVTNLSPGNYTLRAYRKGGGETVAEHVAVGATGVKLPLKATGSLSGTVTRTGGMPPLVSVAVSDAKTGVSREEQFFMTDGKFTISDLPAGHFKVSANAAGGNAMIELDLAEGETKTGLSIALAELLTLKGRIVELTTKTPVPGIRVMAMPSQGGGSFSFSMGDSDEEADATSGADGRFTVKKAPPGKVSLRGFPKDYGESEYGFLSVTRTISGTGVVDLGDLTILKRRTKPGDIVGRLGVKFKQQPPDTEEDQRIFEVSFIEPDGPAAKTELEVGDIITSIDGVDIRGENAAQAVMLMRAPVGTVLTLGLARNASVAVTLAAP